MLKSVFLSLYFFNFILKILPVMSIMFLLFNWKGDFMFEVSINDRNYTVFLNGEHVMFFSINETGVLPGNCSYDLEMITYPGGGVFAKYVNTVPVIVNNEKLDNPLILEGNEKFRLGFGAPIGRDDLLSLSRYYDKQMEKNPTEEYKEDEILDNDLNDIRKSLVKKRDTH